VWVANLPRSPRADRPLCPATRNGKRTWRIAFLRRRFSPTGGAERYLLRLASGLAAQGHQITLYCEDWSPFRRIRFRPRRKDRFRRSGFLRPKVMARPMRDRHDIVFSLERVPGCDLYRAGDGVHADWLAYRRAFIIR
jgi:UDP-glucose:(heptosyl)LPS alpha-1,3-glucosyltransferase